MTGADLIVGTSAGSTAAAQVASTTPTELFASILLRTPPANPSGQPTWAAPSRPAANHMERTRRSSPLLRTRPTCAAGWARRRWNWTRRRTARASPVARHRRRPAAQPARPQANSSSRRSTPHRRTGRVRPPQRRRPGGRRRRQRCASAPPYRIGDDRYIDGGYRRNENADLAAGYGRVLVLSPFGGRSRHPAQWGMQLGSAGRRAARRRSRSKRSPRTTPARVRREHDGSV